ncbi:MAG: S-adenosyl-l-methionine hydroxide adenosyltransferase family protein, partial [Rhodospirillales bacterium]
SATFHGRDLFAPVAARIARGETPVGHADFDEVGTDRISRPDWPDELPEIVYIDDFGNAMTGFRASAVPPESGISVSGQVVRQARNFSDSPEGEIFWYENANGLVELSVNQGRADEILGLKIGSNVAVRRQ